MKIAYDKLVPWLLVAIFSLTTLLFITNSSYSQIVSQIVYSHLFEKQVAYPPGTPQYDDWESFRSSLPPSGVTSITMSGSRNTEGRTCDDPLVAQQIADSMRAGADGLTNGVITLSVNCGGFIWNTGSCYANGIQESINNLEINVGELEIMCDCQNFAAEPNWTIRPILPAGDWGGIDGNVCDALEQTMTLVVEVEEFSNVPTLSEWGLIAMAGILGLISFIVIRRRKVTA